MATTDQRTPPNRSEAKTPKSDTTEADASQPPKRNVLFEYPALPRLEITFYFLVVIITIAYGWHRVFVTSRTYDWTSDSPYEIYEDVKLLSNGPTYRKDLTNAEWRFWSIYVRKVLPWLAGHALLFNLTELVLPKCVWSVFMLAYWILAHTVFIKRKLIVVTLAQGACTFCVARFTRSKVLSWLFAVVLLYITSATDIFVTYDIDGYGYYAVVITFPYKTVQYLTFVTEMLNDRYNSVRQPKQQESGGSTSPAIAKWSSSFFGGLYDMFWYAFYLPYSSHMIVTYKRFPAQLAARSSIKRNWSEIIIFGLRIAFWYLVADLLLYACYFEAMMNNAEFLKSIPEDTLVSIGYATGQFFHLKYVVIFGVVAFFARVDKMQPFSGPICISRVVLYSKVWRCFDRGLYDFFKEYIFLPICRPTFSIPRKIFGVLVSYAFVLLWHGTDHQYVIWIVLNVSELFLEITTKILYTIPGLRETREKYVSDRTLRRTLAWLQIIPFAFGLYSNFYFLGSSESGWVFVDRIFWGETVPVHWPFILLISLGYCYCHVCMEVDRLQSQRPKESEKLKQKKED